MKEKETNKEIVNFEKFSVEYRPTPKTLSDTAKLFGEVFSGYPWFEVNKCTNCETMYGENSKVGEDCTKCHNPLVKAYPIEEVTQFIASNFKSNGIAMFLALKEDEVVGFAWGNLKRTEDYINKFGKYSDAAKQTIISNFGKSENFFYLAELGVAQNLRGQGLGKNLLIKLINEGLKYKVPISAWTRFETMVTPMCIKLGFKQIFGPEVMLENNKVKLTGKIITGLDPEMSERVLFVKN
jgi:GNAT superfamily N-acetyltransferase